MIHIFGLILILLVCSVGDLRAWAADRLCLEDFEQVTPGPVPENNPTGKGEISVAARTFWGRDGVANGGFLGSGGNPGKCAMAYVGPYLNDRSYSEPKWRFDSKFSGSKELYLKFDLRVDPNLGTSYANREVYNFKLIRITDCANAGAESDAFWSPQMNFTPGSSDYSWYTWSEQSCYAEYYFTRARVRQQNHAMDNRWHTYEIYINIGSHVSSDKNDAASDGIVRVWEDGVLIIEDTSVPMRCGTGEGRGINSMAFIRHAKSLGSPGPDMSGNLYFDNVEVWDGMPTAGGDTVPPSTTGHQPGRNATEVAADTNITVHVQDSGDGVNRSSIVMRVNGQAVTPVITGTTTDYALTYDPPANFNPGDTVNVTVNASDLHSPPNVMPTDQYNFTIADTAAPVAPGKPGKPVLVP